MTATLFGYPIRQSEMLAEDEAIRLPEGVIVVHPVTFIYLSEPDLVERLRKVLAYRVARALERFGVRSKALAVELDAHLDRFVQQSTLTLNRWQIAHIYDLPQSLLDAGFTYKGTRSSSATTGSANNEEEFRR